MRYGKPVRLETAPTGPDKSGSKPRGESVYLFLEFTINNPIIAVDLGRAAILFDDLFGMIIRSGLYQFERLRR